MPSIIDGLFAGRAGIQSHGTAISVLADNIANANTVGYKASRPDFTDLLAGAAGGAGAITVGSGSQLNSVTQIFNQGTFEFTGRGLDLAVDGNGFFVVEDQGGTGARYYSRAGNFSVDPDGNLLNQNGFNVMGFATGGGGGLTALNVNQRSSTSVNTNTITVSGNLDASQPIIAAPAAQPTTYTALSGANFSTFVDVFDTLGGSHTLTTYFFHTAANNWTAQTYVDGGDIDVGTAGVPVLMGSVNLVFNSSGSKTTPPIASAQDYFASMTASHLPVAHWANGSADSNIAINLEPFTQFSSASNISSISQDGTGGGSVVSFSVENDGSLIAQLDNGQTSTIGTIALSTFANVEGMKRVGDSLYKESTTSGEPVIGSPGAGTFGQIAAGSLELSTSDIASDFIKLISFQRGFQGSSRVITSINDLLNEIINLAG